MGIEQVQPVRDRVDFGVLAMNKYFTFPKAPGLEPHHQMQEIYRGSYTTTVVSLAYFTAPVVWAASLFKSFLQLMLYTTLFLSTKICHKLIGTKLNVTLC